MKNLVGLHFAMKRKRCTFGVLLVYFWCAFGVHTLYYRCTFGVLMVTLWCIGMMNMTEQDEECSWIAFCSEKEKVYFWCIFVVLLVYIRCIFDVHSVFLWCPYGALVR